MKTTQTRKLLQERENETSSASIHANAFAHQNYTTGTSFHSINNPFDSSMVLTVVVLLTALFFMGFFSIYIRRFSDDSATRRRRTTPSTPSFDSSRIFTLSKYVRAPLTVRSLPIVSYGGPALHPIDCIICLAEFEVDEQVKMIPCCKHVFHPGCIDTWLASHVSCPLCRSTKMDDQTVEEDAQGIRMCEDQSRERWTVDDERDTRRNIILVDIRRTRSWSSLNNCAALQRSNSF